MPRSCSASGDAGIELLAPRLRALSTEQRAEAVALLAELLLAAVCPTDERRGVPAAEVELREGGRAA